MFQFTFQMFSFIEKIFNIFSMIYNNLFGYLYPGKLYEVFIKNLMKRVWMRRMNYTENEEKNTVMKKKIRVGLLTNEIPPIVYGGVATWIVNFIKMFDGDENIEIIPIFLAYNDKLPEDCLKDRKSVV